MFYEFSRTVFLNDAKTVREAFSRPEFCGRAPLKFFKEGNGKRGLWSFTVL